MQYYTDRGAVLYSNVRSIAPLPLLPGSSVTLYRVPIHCSACRHAAVARSHCPLCSAVCGQPISWIQIVSNLEAEPLRLLFLIIFYSPDDDTVFARSMFILYLYLYGCFYCRPFLATWYSRPRRNQSLLAIVFLRRRRSP